MYNGEHGIHEVYYYMRCLLPTRDYSLSDIHLSDIHLNGNA